MRSSEERAARKRDWNHRILASADEVYESEERAARKRDWNHKNTLNIRTRQPSEERAARKRDWNPTIILRAFIDQVRQKREQPENGIGTLDQIIPNRSTTIGQKREQPENGIGTPGEDCRP